ncbi:MAG TPA: NAD-glutamate dehydrogenase domain-containing protein [Baekduia sp.]|uniref:NAD-glutamate dehydrogenase n=1 Tax=Baekduia sp. TaxID=2600305 RepID=UPI002C7E2A7F|nr:NAD-glutamate dehydrogenase domain-containing protein [Baekduia sp.]HMJ36067.1 NAD-glutamate dehydrogenase domain-containing protein [Baekduia sp.]
MSLQEESAGSTDDIADVVCRLARDQGDETLARFVGAYLRRAAGVDGRTDRPEALLAEARGAFGLADARGGASAAVRAFTPSIAEHGYDTAGSVLETATDDLPFLVDSVTAELHARGLAVTRAIHPIVGVRRGPGPASTIVAIEHPRDAQRESVMHFELDRRLSPEELADLEDAARHVLATVRAVVGDFPGLHAGLDRIAEIVREGAPRLGDAEDAEEAVAFLRWAANDHFVFLGYREDELGPRRPQQSGEPGARRGEGAGDRMQAVPGTGLGLLRDHRDGGELRVPAHDPPAATDLAEDEVLTITKTHALSPVHRREPMNALIARRFGADGRVAGEARLLGLFTSRAYAEPASTTPLLRRKLRQILDAEDLIDGSHDSKAAVALFDGYPKGELFAAPVEDLREQVAVLLALHPDEVRLLGRRAHDGRGASLVASLPRERYGATLRERLRSMVAGAYGVDHVETHEVFGEDDRVALHLTVRSSGGLPEVDVAELERRLVLEARTWSDRVAAILVGHHGPERGRMLAARWVKRLPESYRAAAAPQIAAADIERFETLTTGRADFLVGLQEERGPGGGRRTRVAFYRRGPKVELSQATPMLEHLGLRVIEEVAARLQHSDDELWVQAFGVLGEGDEPLHLHDVGDRVADSLQAVWHGEAESDSLNRLVVSGGLRWPQVQVLRAYRRYRQRIGSRYTESFQNDVIAANAAITAKQIRLFELRFATDERAGDDAAYAALRDEIRSDMDAVELLDHDRILRNQLGVIEATVRTNVFRPDRDAMSFKLRSADVPAIPQPAPLFEIYVYAPDMEGIHLRGGRIARGGIRWSDRMDYRTEVFGLMRAQMTKNAVIVPAGAKGGFFLKERPGDPAQLRDEVKRQYVRYIEALLDVTDDLTDEGTVVPPTAVRVHDEQDSYLVVAADKGTAAFSDTANAIAVRRGFWLGDAFASGGSAGYDHKGLGITAKGAWESVKRHFRELGMHPEVDVVRAVGIGDMSGDVFGNGMLLSRTLKLVASYDHRHVFLDPDPDPERSFAERERLFGLGGSSWDDYDRAAISEGGGVFSRTAKQIPITPQVREALGIEDEALAPTDLIRAILRAPVDLVWNGGIGTIVKASTETDADALDRSSDAIRVNGDELRARVVGEGGNLGFTQRARIEYSRAGGLINADFIDNSAGVDISDHEVNLKILLDLGVRRGGLDREGRDALLAEVTEDVVGHVLYDSFLQAQILAQEVRSSAARVFAYEDLMAALEGAAILHRSDEALPPSDEMAERRRTGEGLVRPELAVLVAYAKRMLTDELLESGLPDDPAFERDLRTYFPRAVVQRFGDLIAEHPLRRELVATLAANDVVDALGPTFVSGLQGELGAAPAEVVRAFRIAREVTGATARWLEIEGHMATLHHEAAWRLLDGVDELVSGVARWYLLHAPNADLDEMIDVGGAAFVTLADAMPDLRSDEWREEHEAVAAELTRAGVPEALARTHAYQRALLHAPDIIAVAHATGGDVVAVARTFFELGERLGLEWLEQEVLALPAGTRVQRWAQQALLDDVLDARRVLSQRALEEAGTGADPSAAVDAFLDQREAERRRLTTVARALRLEGDGGLAGLTLAVRHLRGLAG